MISSSWAVSFKWACRQRRACSGVGGQSGSGATGKKRLSFRAVVSRGAVSGCLKSHQLKDSDRAPLLLSLPAQVSVGLVKDLARGRAL